MKKQDFDIKLFSTRFSSILEASAENTHSLAKKLGLSPASISRYAKGIMAPKYPTLYAIADIFNVNPAWLFGYDVSKEVESAENPLVSRLLTAYDRMNEIGKQVAVQRVEELSKIPEYQEKSIPSESPKFSREFKVPAQHSTEAIMQKYKNQGYNVTNDYHEKLSELKVASPKFISDKDQSLKKK